MNLATIIADTMTYGVATYSLHFGDMSSTPFFSVAVVKETEVRLDEATMDNVRDTTEGLRAYTMKHSEELAREDRALGTWIGDDSKFCIDVVECAVLKNGTLN